MFWQKSLLTNGLNIRFLLWGGFAGFAAKRAKKPATVGKVFVGWAWAALAWFWFLFGPLTGPWPLLGL